MIEDVGKLSKHLDEVAKRCDSEVAQGTPEPPKVEEIADKIVKSAAEWFWGCARPESDAREQVIELLGPYFPPASQTPRNIIDASQECLRFMDSKPDVFGLAIIDNGTNNRMEELRKALATPASTARTDGWVSVAIKPKGEDEDFGVLAAAPGWTVWAEYIPEKDKWINSITRTEIHPQVWREIPMYTEPAVYLTSKLLIPRRI
jgi:hypothetical protein